MALSRCPLIIDFAVLALMISAGPVVAEPPRVIELRVQQVAGARYFHVRLEMPAVLRWPDKAYKNARVHAPFSLAVPITITLPRADARLWFDGKFSPGAGVTRSYRTEPLEFIYTYRYVLTASWTEAGKETVAEREVLLKPGLPVEVDFTKPQVPIAIESLSDLRDWNPRDSARLARLVPQDDKTSAVYYRWNYSRNGVVRFDRLEFVGKIEEGKGPAKMLLLYPRIAKVAADPEKRSLADLVHTDWAEEPLTLDFDRATEVSVPNPPRFLSAPDKHLDRLWAAGQMHHFALLEAQTPEFGFYGSATEMTALKYLGQSSRLDPPAATNRQPTEHELTRRRYELTTGAAAITESLALNRLRRTASPRQEKRTVDVHEIRGIDIAEHPWERMMAGKKPSPEPLAQLTPSDNYYVHFKNIARFLETGDLIDEWGSLLSRVWEVHSRDYHVKERLEQQLCLKSSKLARLLGPAVVKSVAVTGSDPYIREGSDVTVVFHVANRQLFLASVEPYLQEARTAFAGRLKEGKSTYLDVTIESFVTPAREVSLHRAMFDDFVVCSNSPIGLRRVLDVYKGKSQALAESLDYRYMRTVFRLEDPLEDGFIFLPDAFIRKLVGPATRIKEARRLDALTGLALVNNGALFTAWETGKLPASHEELLKASALTDAQLRSADGESARWDGERKLAVSAMYNTMNFATPLIELPIDKVTPGERDEYNDFRSTYLGLWRKYFDPVGMRIRLGDAADSPAGAKQIRWETYILPLVKNSEYDNLRWLTGDGTVKLDPAMFSGKTVMQIVSHLSPAARKWIGDVRIQEKIPALNFLGDWYTLRLDDDPAFGNVVDYWVRSEIEGTQRGNVEHLEQLLQLPWTFGVQIRNPLVFAGALAHIRNNGWPRSWEPMKVPYKGVQLVKIEKGFFFAYPDSFYYALLDGVWYISTRQQSIHDLIDAAEARKKARPNPDRPLPEINTSYYLGRKAAVQSRKALEQYLEWQTHRRAVVNCNVLYPLYRGRIVSATEDAAAVRAAALKCFGFVPVSPDYTAYVFDRKTDAIVNARHGSPARPRLHAAMAESSPLARLLQSLQTLRADLRFREDGLQTVLTLERK